MLERSKALRPVKTAPKKPYNSFPLFAHRSGVWAKKIAGRTVYFGPWADHDGALQRYRDFMLGRDSSVSAPTGPPDASVREICNYFLHIKKQKVDSGKLSPRSFANYLRSCRKLAALLGKHRKFSELQPTDFLTIHSKVSAEVGPISLSNFVRNVRAVFKLAADLGLIPNRERLTLRQRPLPTVRDFIRHLAALGGFLMRKGDGEPGWITLWRGTQHLTIALQTQAAIKRKCGS